MCLESEPVNYEKWLGKNAASLRGRTVAVSGSTGGLGRELCDHLAYLGADLILLDRNRKKSEEHKTLLKNKYEKINIRLITVDFEDIRSVAAATDALRACMPDVLIVNAGAYSIPRHRCESGYDNVFQINFASPYYMVRELLPELRARRGHVVAVGSIAHDYSRTDPADIDFSTRTAASRVYGNAKRYLMFSLFELFRNETEATLSVVHPGITFTGITSHYPKLIFAVIKHPMKVVFMRPRKAALTAVLGVMRPTAYSTWIGPRVFNIWGLPAVRKLRTVSHGEASHIFASAETVYRTVTDTLARPSTD